MRILDWLRGRRARKDAALIEQVEKWERDREAAPDGRHFLSDENPHQHARDESILNLYPTGDDER